jgi:SAM-dependent methyltransferase
LAHGYQSLQHWNQWLSQQFLGTAVLKAEKNLLARLLDKHYGKHALLVGVPHQSSIMEATKIPCHTLVSPFMAHERQPGFVEGDLHELPFLTGSVDLVILPHTLEYVDNPRHLIHEACRVVRPEGLIVAIGFNPYSLWGLRRLISHHHDVPWTSHFAYAYQIKNWLRLAEFQVEEHTSLFFRPPLKSARVFNRLEFLESIGNLFHFFGGIYCITARAKVIPMTPIRMQWKQRLDNIRISTTISGNIARQSESLK